MVARAVASNVANAAVAVPTVYSSRTKAAFGRRLHIGFSDFATSHRFIRSYHNSSNPSHLRVKLRSTPFVVSTAVFSFADRDLVATIHCASAFTTTDVYVTSASPMSGRHRRTHAATATLPFVAPSSRTVAATRLLLLQSLIVLRPSNLNQHSASAQHLSLTQQLIAILFGLQHHLQPQSCSGSPL